MLISECSGVWLLQWLAMDDKFITTVPGTVIVHSFHTYHHLLQRYLLIVNLIKLCCMTAEGNPSSYEKCNETYNGSSQLSGTRS